MNLHEYQSKEILAKYGVAIQRGFVANNVDEAVAAAEKLTAETGAQGWVVKHKFTPVVVVKVVVLSSLKHG